MTTKNSTQRFMVSYCLNVVLKKLDQLLRMGIMSAVYVIHKEQGKMAVTHICIYI